MKKLAAIAALSTSVLGLSAGASFADYTLNILHINDWHSRIESNNKFESTCSAEEEGKGECFGGAARLITAIKQEREKLKDQNVVLLSAGDNFQGSLFYTTYKGKAEGEFLNDMGFDAMALGNHEFDDGEDALVPFIDQAKFPILGVNIKPNNQSKANGKIKPSVVLEIGGEKIGIIGAVTTETPEIASPGPNIQIEDDVANIAAEVKKLSSEGVSKIIALTHIGYPREMEMIAKIPGVDVVVGGHSHTLLSNNPDDKAAGPYPTWVDNPLGYKVPVVQAASYSKVLGELNVTFNDIGIVKEAKGDPLWLDKSIIPDPAVLKRVAELAAPIEELKNKEVGETSGPIDGSRDNCRAKECEMGNLVSDAVLDRVKGQGVTMVFTNGGGLRASIDQGVVTMGEVLTVLPFQNTSRRSRSRAKMSSPPWRTAPASWRKAPAGSLRSQGSNTAMTGRNRQEAASPMSRFRRAATGRRSTRPEPTRLPPTTTHVAVATATKCSPKKRPTPMISVPALNRQSPTI